MKIAVSNLRRVLTTNAALSTGKTVCLSTEASVVTPETSSSQISKSITSAMIRSLYRDFIHIVKVQQKQSKPKTKKPQLQPTNPLQQVRDEFRQPTFNETRGTSTTTIESRYQYGINRLSFLRMNTIQCKPRTHNYAKDASNTSGTDTTGTTTSTGTERYMYKNGQRYALHSIQDGTLRNNQRSGYVISPYDGKNLDPQSVTRHRQSLKRAGFINNLHAKGMF